MTKILKYLKTALYCIAFICLLIGIFLLIPISLAISAIFFSWLASHKLIPAFLAFIYLTATAFIIVILRHKAKTEGQT